MKQLRRCLQCGTEFEYKRSDHFFCAGKCVAAFYRDNPNPEMIHAELPHDRPVTCEWCGEPYTVNGYADRGGERKPKYCTRKHKQAAYRARCKETQAQAARRNERPGWDSTTQQQADETSRRANEQARQRTYATKRDEALDILRLPNPFTKQELIAAYRKKMFEVHPDLNHHPDATSWAQKVNWAYQYLKK